MAVGDGSMDDWRRVSVVVEGWDNGRWIGVGSRDYGRGIDDKAGMMDGGMAFEAETIGE